MGALASLRNAELEVEAYGLTPLHLAAGFSPNPEVAELLLEWGADITRGDDWNRTALQWAAWNGGPESVALLLEWGATPEQRDNNDYKRPLHYAAAYNPDKAVAELLLQWGANVAAQTYNHQTPLHLAAQYNSDKDVAALLLDNGSNIEAQADYNLTPLHHAVHNSTAEIAALLLDRGANVEAQGDSGLFSREYGFPGIWGTPLHHAALIAGNPRRAEEMVKLLLDRGASIEAVNDYGLTPLLAVVQFHHQSNESTPEDAVAMIELLLDQGANIEAKVERDGWTPLFHATNANQPEVAELLLERGADSKATNSQGQTPCQVARDRGSFVGTPLLGRLCRPS